MRWVTRSRQCIDNVECDIKIKKHTFIGKIYQFELQYLPNPLCSRDEKVTIASKRGAFPDMTSLEN